MWEDVVYTKAQAKFKFQQIEVDPENCAPRQVKAPFDKLRKQILEQIAIFLEDDDNKIKSYAFDLNLGLFLYTTLNEDYGFTERLAAQDEMWRYLSLEVFPDIVYKRYDMNDVRFYQSTRRIWLRSIWWYIHLSWQGTKEATYAILKDNSSDDLLQLIDRSGSGGYRKELTRELMRQNSLYNSQKTPRLFRRLLKLNTARLNIIEPTLVEGGVEKYVSDLYEYFMQNVEQV